MTGTSFVIVDGTLVDISGLWEEGTVVDAGWEELPLDLFINGSLGTPQVVIVDGVVMPVVSVQAPDWAEIVIANASWTEVPLTVISWTEVAATDVP